MPFVAIEDVQRRGATPRRGFTPIEELASRTGARALRAGFTPIEDIEPEDGAAAEAEGGSALRQVLLNNPLTAIGETALNLATQAIAVPASGLAGLGAAAGRLVGLGERTGADVVHAVGNALTYQPRGEMGQALTGAVLWPFEKLAEGGRFVGERAQDAGAPASVSTAIETAIVGGLPLAITPAARAARRAWDGRADGAGATGGTGGGTPRSEVRSDGSGAPVADPGGPAPSVQPNRAPGFTPVDEVAVQRGVAPDANTTRSPDGALDQSGAAQRGAAPENGAGVALDAQALHGPEVTGLAEVWRGGDSSVPAVAGELSGLRERRGLGADAQALDGAPERAGALRADELRLDTAGAPDAAPDVMPIREAVRPGDDVGRGVAPADAAGGVDHGLTPGRTGPDVREAPGAQAVPGIPLDRLQGRAASTAGGGAAGGDAVRAAVGPGEAGRSLAASADARAPTPEGLSGTLARTTPERFDAAPVTARYALVEADSLRPSHDINLRPTPDYPEGLARENWTRTDTEQRVQAIVQDFEPARLGAALGDGDGAPVITRDGTVHAGNARAVAIQRVYQANGLKADTYRAYLREQAPNFGIDPARVGELRKPVLVRVPDQPPAIPQPIPQPRVRLEAQPEPARAPLPETPAVQAAVRSAEPVQAEHVQAMAPGANYVGLINDGPGVGGAGGGAGVRPGQGPQGGAQGGARVADRPAPLRREDILIEFAKALDTGVYEGRIKGGRMLGFFRPKTGEVRIKRHADLEVAAHELAHLVDKRFPEIRKSWSTGPDWQARRNELRDLSYDRTKIDEGFAEYVRHWMTRPELARERAPKFTQWFEDFTQRAGLDPAMRRAQEGMTGWFRQDAIDRARSKIGDHKPITDAMDGRWDAFRQATVDDLHGVYRLEREIKGGKIAPTGAYETARLTRAAASMADGAVRFGAPVKRPDGSYGWRGKGLEEILKPVAEKLDDALLYFVGRSARELQAQGREHLFTSGEIDAMLKLRTPEADKAFAEYQQWNAAILDFAEAHGVINPEARRHWQRMEYLPFHRVGQPGGFKGKPGDWSGVKALTGGTENIRDVLGNMVSNAAMLIEKAVKNEARLKIAELAESSPEGGKFMAKIPAESRPVKLPTSSIADAVIEAMGLDKSGSKEAAQAAARLRKLLEGAPAMLELLQPNAPPAGRNVVAVLREGKPTWYEVGDPILLRALEAIDREPPPWVVKWLGLPKRIGQTTITLTPDFMVANLARDTLMGAVMSRSGFKPFVDSAKGMRLRITNDPLYKEFIANGGGLSSMFLDEAKLRTKLERFYGRQGIDYRTVLDTPDKLLSFVETLADAFEMSTRLGEYRRAVEAGENPRHAAYLAREVSTDFAMRGDSKALGFLYDTVMFLRPAVVSFDRLYRGLAHDPNKGAIATKAGMIGLASTALYLLNRGDARYDDLPDWDRDTHWHFFVGDQHFRYPKIWEIGALGSIAERTAERLMDDDPAGLGKDYARIVANTFSLNLMPQVIAPLWEQARNRNSFTKAPIETPGMENVQPFLRAKPTTSETMKAAGMATRNLPEALQVNPTRAEALLRGYFNTWAMYGLMVTDKAFFDDKGPELRADQLPVVRRFYSQEPARSTKYESLFYDMLGEASRVHGTLRELDRQGHGDVADEIETNPLAQEAKPLERANKNLSAINRDMRQVRRSDMTPEDKRKRLDELTVERNALLKASVLDAQASLKDKGRP